MHMTKEIARHAGHADILRESIDGKIAYELSALADGKEWPRADGEGRCARQRRVGLAVAGTAEGGLLDSMSASRGLVMFASANAHG